MAQAVERRWWRRYLGGRDVEAYASWKRAYWRRLLRRTGHARVLEQEWQYRARVLDAGCGPAGVFTVLAKASVTAVDPLLDSYDELPHFCRTDHPNVHWRSVPLETYEEAGGYDYVFCLNVLNHVRDLSAVLRVLAAALDPDGTLVLSVDAHRHAWLKPLFRFIPGDVLHPHQLGLSEYEAAFLQAGLVIVDRTLYGSPALFDYWVLSLKLAENERP